MTSFDEAMDKINGLPRSTSGQIKWRRNPQVTAVFVAAFVAAPRRGAWIKAAAAAIGASVSGVKALVSRFSRGLDSGNAEWPELRAELVRLGVLLAKPPAKVDPSRAVVRVGGVPIVGAAPDTLVPESRPAARRETIAAGADLVVTETRVLAYGTPEHKAALIELLRGLKIGTTT